MFFFCSRVESDFPHNNIAPFFSYNWSLPLMSLGFSWPPCPLSPFEAWLFKRGERSPLKTSFSDGSASPLSPYTLFFFPGKNPPLALAHTRRSPSASGFDYLQSAVKIFRSCGNASPRDSLFPASSWKTPPRNGFPPTPM